MLRHLIQILAARGKTILYSSHVLDNVERLCANVVVLHRGRIVAEGPVSELRAMTRQNASLEDVIAQLVTTVDPARTAVEIADLSGLSA
jgi:ABC-2 type transport system ATP-binding protein